MVDAIAIPVRRLRPRDHVLVTVSYAVACTIFGGLSLPLVFTSVVWLPAGLAFGIVYARGYATIPALFIGAILGLLTRVVDVHGQLAPGVSLQQTTIGVLLEACIVVGHAALGTWLVRRFVGDLALTTVRSASAYLLLAGPVACLVGSVLGPPAMLVRSITDVDGMASVAFGFFGGDGMGVLLLAPLVAALAGPPAAWRGRVLPILVTSLATIAALTALHAMLVQSESRRVELIFASTGERHLQRAERELDRIEQALDARAGSADLDQLDGVRAIDTLELVGGAWHASDTGARTDSSVGAIDLQAATSTLESGAPVVTAPVGERAPTQLVLHQATGRTLVRRATVDVHELLDASSSRTMFDDADVAISDLHDADEAPRSWSALGGEARRFLVDDRIAPHEILLPHRAATVDRVEVSVGDRAFTVALAPSVGYIRQWTYLQAAITPTIASMLLAFVAGVSMLVLTGRNLLLAGLVEERTTELDRTMRRYRDVVDNIADVIIRVDDDDRISFASRAWHTVMAPATLAPEGMLLASFVEPEDRIALTSALARARAGIVVEHVEARVHGAMPPRWIQLRVRLNADEGSVVGTIVDTTPRHALEQAREQFVSMVSHEFRTPVTVISGSIDTIDQREADQLPPISRRLMPAMQSASRRLLRLVEDLLFAARLDAGTMSFDRRPLDLGSVVRDGVARARIDALQAEVELRAEIPSEPIMLHGDPDRLGQLIDNLLSNAIKFSTARGIVEVRVTRAPGEEHDVALVSIRDHGVGIDGEDMPRLFDRFWRAGTADGTAAGTGLGLAICRQVAEAHRGTITVDSTLGAGSTFVVALPLSGFRSPRDG